MTEAVEQAKRFGVRRMTFADVTSPERVRARGPSRNGTNHSTHHASQSQLSTAFPPQNSTASSHHLSDTAGICFLHVDRIISAFTIGRVLTTAGQSGQIAESCLADGMACLTSSRAELPFRRPQRSLHHPPHASRSAVCSSTIHAQMAKPPLAHNSPNAELGIKENTALHFTNAPCAAFRKAKGSGEEGRLHKLSRLGVERTRKKS